MKTEFDKAMNALLLHVDKIIVDSIRKIGHEYADEVAEKQRRAVWDWYIHWMFTDEELAASEHLRTKKAFLNVPLVTESKQEQL